MPETAVGTRHTPMMMTVGIVMARASFLVSLFRNDSRKNIRKAKMSPEKINEKLPTKELPVLMVRKIAAAQKAELKTASARYL
jgi:hypothetical protein